MQRPSGRFHPGVEQYHLARYPEDRAVLEAFTYAFDVTFAQRRVGTGRAEATIAYLRPLSQQLEGMVGVGEQEILLYLSPHDAWQARALDMHDQTLADERSRLDQRFSLIVSGDTEITLKIKDLMARDPERPTSIGIPRAVLTSVACEADIIGALRQRVPSRDLFAFESPLVQDSLFFGRDQILADLSGRIAVGQNSGLFGLRRIGKTSVLNAVQRRLHGSRTATCVYRDASSAYNLRWWSFLHQLVSDAAKLVAAGKATHKRLNLDTPYTESTASSRFGEDIEVLTGIARGGRLVLLLDEIEYITFDISPKEFWTEDFLSMWTALRSVHQNSRGAFSYVVAGVNPYALEKDRVGRYDNPLFSTTKAYFLDPFDAGSTSEMVRRVGRMMGLTFQRELLEQLYREYGGHPFLTRRACSALATSKPERPAHVTRSEFLSMRDSINHDLEKNARQILTVLETWYPDEFELLVALAHGDRATFDEYASADPTYVSHVQGYGLVDVSAGDARIRIGVVRDYLTSERAKAIRHSEAPSAVDLPSPEDVLAEVSRRRNALEMELRSRLRLGLQFAYGPKAGSKLLETLSSKRSEVLAGFSYASVWQELYFNELQLILNTHWTVFSSWLNTSKEEVDRWMDHINRSRADAHARSLTIEDLAYLRVCFSKLERYCELSGGASSDKR